MIIANVSLKQDIIVREVQRGKKITCILGKGNSYSSNCSGLNHCKKTPSIKETNKWVIRFTEVNILATGLGKHTTQFSIAHCSCDSHKSRDEPNEYKPSGTTNVSHDICAHNKNP